MLSSRVGSQEDERVARRHPAGALSKGTAGFRHMLSSATCLRKEAWKASSRFYPHLGT